MSSTVRRWKPWLVVGLVVAVVVLLLARSLIARRAQMPSAQAATAPAAALQLGSADVVQARMRELERSLEVSGALKAVNSAVVKARVAGEVKSLTVREGDRVRAGQLLGQIDATEYQWKLRQAQEQAAASRAQLDIAERALENNRALVDQGFISKNAVDTSVSNAAAARATLQASNAAAELARKAVADAELRAPIDGIVSVRAVQPGERVGIDARIVEIVDLARIELEAAVAPDAAAQLKVGAPARLRVDGIDGDVKARVARINPAAQAGSRAITVYLEVDPHPALRQGLFATGRIELERAKVFAAPESAVRLDQNPPYVMQVLADNVRQKNVETGMRGYADGVPMLELRNLGGADAAPMLLLTGAVGSVRDGTSVRLGTDIELPATAPALASAAAASAAR
ncbi:efflux RND transporter periplasmic adaptor subunit [Rivibacter subsaxonicus]|uniref:RND family efflux transporter MFP subunit n=1 Tax=Rivibacter subsaxonicus TaxID=457575 RepID=A0A4V2FTD1_9BURK|nr:efflux RND transporter periplasmic adaptor subunit [Rivibacter subsaxonicus]RZT97695.1 RND family efflux transporter MFP subunit [Rivibacter subsaxonicus]